ncbi:ABC transporter ATP-binding protein [Clostridiales bacterium COT073_COT-073]|nr:ABC transporter ATP-binding protein [Clostridiales bacterium COT073_COT-073]
MEAVNSYKQDEAAVKVSKWLTIRRLFRYMIKYKKEVLLVFLMMAVTTVVTMINPLLVMTAIDKYIENSDVQGLLRLLAIAVVLNLILVICLRIRILVMGKVSNHVLLEIRQELYTHIQSLGFSFFDKRPTGKILARVIGDVNSLKDVLNNAVVTLVPEAVNIIAVLVIMMTLNYKLALAGVATLPLLVAGMYLVEIFAHKRWQVHRQKSSNMNAFTHEDFSGIAVVQSFTAERQTSKNFGRLLFEVKDSFFKAVVLNDLFWPIVLLASGIGMFLVFYLGIPLIQKGEVSIGMIITFTTYINMFWMPILNLSSFYNQLVSNLTAAERVFEILDTEPEERDLENMKQMPKIEGQIEFKDVVFSYDGEKVVLDNVSFSVDKGETIALVGPTGEGKTTIINALARFYEVKSGQILIDNQDISQVGLSGLRSQMGIMTQDTVLFTGTIADNIRYGKLDATQAEIEEAAKAVQIHDFIMSLEKGYETVINDKGSKLSIGQKQLIAFARTMIAKPSILILDEATASIDTHTERLIQQGITALLKGRTSFIVAHRLSTIKQASRIFFIKNKQISEMGSHSELIEKKGDYYHLYMAQRA